MAFNVVRGIPRRVAAEDTTTIGLPRWFATPLAIPDYLLCGRSLVRCNVAEEVTFVKYVSSEVGLHSRKSKTGEEDGRRMPQ
jgi:hypothetical protein